MPCPAAPLRFWQKIYLATLALFLACLFGGVWGAATVSCRLSFNARCEGVLSRQRAFVQRAAEDIPVVAASRPAVLDALYDYYGQQARADGLRAGIWQNDDQLLNDLPLSADQLPELQTLQPGQRSWQVRLLDGRHILFATTALAGGMEGWRIAVCADIEDFYADWQRTGALFLALCAAVSVVFAAALYLVLRRMNRPLQSLTETARRIAAGDYAARTPAAAARRDELGELGRTLNDASAQIERQVAQLAAEADAKQMLVDDLSHEMRTPLTAIGGYAQTIRLADLRGEELMQAAESIEFESRRLLNLSQQLLQLSVLNHTPLELTETPAAELLDRVRRAVAPKAQSRGVTLTVQCAPGAAGARLRCQPDLMESLLVNLCDNGVKACRPGGQVTLRFACRDGRGVFAVQDTGRGMDAETLARIGRPFYRADKARSRAEGGAGLGVALCYAIARAHGAALTYRSRSGQGTTAVVEMEKTEAK